MPITTNSSGAGKSKRRAIALTAVTVAISARSVMATDTRASLHPALPGSAPLDRASVRPGSALPGKAKRDQLERPQFQPDLPGLFGTGLATWFSR